MIKRKYKAFSKEENGSYVLLSPGIGIFEIGVGEGDILCPGSYIGTLKLLGNPSKVYLPDNVSGIVEPGENNSAIFPVGYKSPVLLLKPEVNGLKKAKKVAETQKSRKTGDQELIVSAFTTGIFYSKPSPESPPFISIGSIVHKGSVLGLIEVMKSFNQIVFTGNEKYESGKVIKIIKEDSSEVRSGDPLFVISVDQGG